MTRRMRDIRRAYHLERAAHAVVAKQELMGVAFDKDLAELRLAELEALLSYLQAEIVHLLPPLVTPGPEIKKPFKLDGSLSVRAQKWVESGVVGGPFCGVEIAPPELSSRQQVVQSLLKLGWQPHEHTPTGQPKLTDDSLENMPKLRPLLLWSKLAHRRNQISGWVREIRPDGRIPAGGVVCGSNTGRMYHRVVANVPKANKAEGRLVYYPDGDVVYGTEMRELFVAAPGYSLVGVDLAGLEMRILAHHMVDPEFTETVLSGDIHTLFLDEVRDLVPSRSVCKNTEYCMIYGGSDYKMGLTAGAPPSEARRVGAEIRRRWMTRLPRLKSLIERVQKAARRGYLIGLDGRPVRMRRDDTGQVYVSKALNTLIQSDASVLAKTVMVWYNKRMAREMTDDEARQVIFYHDEYVVEVRHGLEERIKELILKTIRDTGDYYGLRCPIEGEGHVGRNWAEIH